MAWDATTLLSQHEMMMVLKPQTGKMDISTMNADLFTVIKWLGGKVWILGRKTTTKTVYRV